jgi:hypothetical protein
MADASDKYTFWSNLQKIVKQPDNQNLILNDQQTIFGSIKELMSSDEFNKFISVRICFFLEKFT